MEMARTGSNKIDNSLITLLRAKNKKKKKGSSLKLANQLQFLSRTKFVWSGRTDTLVSKLCKGSNSRIVPSDDDKRFHVWGLILTSFSGEGELAG
jgi:hypothetical protein